MKAKSLANFYHQYATLMDAGVAHQRALAVLGKQGDRASRRLAQTLTRRLKSGETFTEALGAMREIPALHVALIAAGERSGQLDVVLQRLGTVVERQAAMRARFLGKLLYPVILLHVAVLVRSIVLLFAEGTEAAVLAAVMGFGLLYGLALGGGLLWKLLRALPPTRMVLDVALIQVPVIGGLLRNLGVGRFARSCEVLYQAGFSLADAVEQGAQAMGNASLRRRCRRAVPVLREGTDLGQAMATTGLLSPIQQGMLETGVESGRIDQMLTKIAEQAEQAAEHRLNQLGTLVPLLIYFGVVILIVMQILSMLRGYLDMINEFL